MKGSGKVAGRVDPDEGLGFRVKGLGFLVFGLRVQGLVSKGSLFKISGSIWEDYMPSIMELQVEIKWEMNLKQGYGVRFSPNFSFSFLKRQ